MTTLRHYRLCPHSRSIRMLLAELQISVTLQDEKPWEWPEDLLALNPSGELPVLETEAGDVICGAYAISEWVSDERTAQPPDAQSAHCVVLPGDAVERAEVRRLIDWFHGKMHREVTSFLLDEKVFGRFRDGAAVSPDAANLRAVRANMAQHLRYIDYITGTRKWLAGNTLSFADFAAAGQLSCVDYLGEIDWTGREDAKLWYARLKSRPAVREVLVDRIPGAPEPPDHYTDPDF